MLGMKILKLIQIESKPGKSTMISQPNNVNELCGLNFMFLVFVVLSGHTGL